ncbi:hypothetical protein N7532_001204 [Penicillium argentinense]|uniref:Uncharacterized protein n=1 Tax=Penicillium argentinense TaxID=1131581 RepID=A0A9W9KL15_9EURO|nr:uncharacterized protein N7532_001204 [Penicillium argentinense]KAJ5110669.1 hypothetical protein N7532_001204 [Penicillium argentinense]
MARSYPYPPIPADCVDSIKPGHHSPWEMDLVTRTHSDKWGPREIAVAKALQETRVHLGNECLLRTHHRSLAPCPFVYETTEADGNKIWGVSIGPNVPVYDTHAAGREIHIHPEFLLPQLSQAYSGSQRDPLPRRINPRRFLPASELEILRRFFPAAIGARVLISGFIIVLFRDYKDIEASWLEGCVPSFGLLRLGYDVAVHYPTQTVVDSGNAVSDSAEGSDTATPLGLKLKFADDSEGITVPTHAFVDVKTPQENMARKEASLLSKTKATFSKATALKLKEFIRVGTTAVASPLGKSVWFVQDPKKVKSAMSTTTFDHHIARASTFPQTIHHDTSIVTGDRLPRVSNPPRAPKIIGWGEYRDALDGHSAFAMALSALTDEPQDPVETDSDMIYSGQCKKPWWRERNTSGTASRARKMEGLSGSVLCLGQPTDLNCRAVLFKHFETPICPQHFEPTDTAALGDIAWSSFKGGFLLPWEIRNAEILCEGEEATAILEGDQTWDIE